MIILGWIFGVLIFLFGLFGFLFSIWLQHIHDAEVEMMKEPNGGKFEEEPDYMKTFREARAEGEAIDNLRRIALFRKISLVGMAILIVMTILWLT